MNCGIIFRNLDFVKSKINPKEFCRLNRRKNDKGEIYLFLAVTFLIGRNSPLLISD